MGGREGEGEGKIEFQRTGREVNDELYEGKRTANTWEGKLD
jgi:hypothetical protein